MIEARQLGGLNMDPVVCVQVSRKIKTIIVKMVLDIFCLAHMLIQVFRYQAKATNVSWCQDVQSENYLRYILQVSSKSKVKIVLETFLLGPNVNPSERCESESCLSDLPFKRLQKKKLTFQT